MNSRASLQRVARRYDRPILGLRGFLLLSILLLLAHPDPALCQADESGAKKLVLDDGRYEESEWARQLAVTADDRYLLTADSKHGVRVYDFANGDLINRMEGHALEGDAYYDARAGIFVTTGDGTIKVWDIAHQTLLKRIQQGFHSQFMKNVYIDTKKEFIFAEGVKYRFDTGKMVKRYKSTADPASHYRYFFQDRYYLLDEKTGRITAYDCFDDKLLTSYTLKEYRQGTDLYFDDRAGRLFTGYVNGVRIVDIATGRSDFAAFDRTGAYRNVSQTSAYAVSADGNFLVAASSQGIGLVVLKKTVPGRGFEGNAREVLRQRLPDVGEVHALNASNRVVYTTGESIQLLDLDTMRLLWVTESKTVGLRNIFLAPNGTELYLSFGSKGKINRHWFERTFAYRFDTYFDSLDANWGTFKADLRDTDLPKDLVAMWRERSQMGRIRLDGDVAVEAVPAKLPFALSGTRASPYDPVDDAVLSPSGRYTLSPKSFGPSTLYDGRRRIGQMPDLAVIYHVEYSPGERYVAAGGSSRWVAVLDLSTGALVRKVYAESYVTSITFSQDQEYLFTGSLKNEIMMWRLRDGKLIRKFVGSDGGIIDTEVSPDGKRLFSIAQDGALRIWDIAAGKMLLAMFFLNSYPSETTWADSRQRPWVVATPDGRFDTNSLEEIRGLHWIMLDDPLHPLPLEIFMRDYYEPRLLPRLVAGEQLPPIRPLTELNLVQPHVQIAGAERAAASNSSRHGESDLVSVTVEVSGSTQNTALAGSKRGMATGVYDLRLFRDGQLVGQWPAGATQPSALASSAEEELAQWRKTRLVASAGEGGKRIVFEGVRLPRRAGVKDVQFSAYAFNEDRVKSETARTRVAIPSDLSPRAARAYVVSVGVNAFDDSRWDLSYAANDATQLGEVLKQRLQALLGESGQARYEKVIWVGLTSEAQIEQGQRRMKKAQASKARIAAVLKTLAGQAVAPDALEGIENARELRRANPEDLVILALSTHGEVDERGRFYLLPQDIGNNATNEQRRGRAISSDELSEWLQGLDVIDLVMIVDACHSAASVESKEFKPGPMGSRGLGQLAYDKGMRILAATQIDQYALETQRTQLGLLTYALVRDGLERNEADFNPKDGRIMISEWLGYATQRVPDLYRDWREGKLRGRRGAEALAAPEDHPGRGPSQQPALFDFARNRDAVIDSARR